MIGCTKLLCGTATVSEALHHMKTGEKMPARLLAFSADLRPLVVWNTTNRCNLRCRHCYISAEDRSYRDELSTDEAKAFLKDIGEMGCPVVLFSGGEPLVRPDVFELTEYGTAAGLRVVYSTNGTLITPEVAQRLAAAGAKYVGVSLDGAREVHDKFRGRQGCFEEALAGVANAAAAGLNTGVRFTVNKVNMDDLPAVIDAVVEHGIPRFCMYHLVYTGRGEEMMSLDTDLAEKRKIMEFVTRKTKELHAAGINLEILTVDNHADGVYVYRQVEADQPERAEEVKQLLEMHGGCSAGQKISNVDPRGEVHACQFWPHVSLGNVRERPFSEIWSDESNPFLKALREKPRHLKGRCGACRFNHLCGGCRIRAEKVTGDLWEADPACYLTDEEIGAAG
ncbi:MAG: radical SAM protein [Armatimonadetes bacterium]|nr:radical SAM protein [Armatimonadota bacterium]